MAIQEVSRTAPVTAITPIKRFAGDPHTQAFESALKEAVQKQAYSPAMPLTAIQAENVVAAHAAEISQGEAIDQIKKKKASMEELQASEGEGAPGEVAEETFASPSVFPKGETATSMMSKLLPEDKIAMAGNKNPGAVPYQGPARVFTPPDPTAFLAQAQPQNRGTLRAANRPLTPKTVNEVGVNPIQRDVTPFQLFLDKAVDFFEMVSGLEEKSDSMMVDFIQGKASLEELTLLKTKLSVALSFSMTLVNQVTQTFKEIQNMQV